MITKDIRLSLWDCEAVIELKTDGDNEVITFSVTELEVDEENTTIDHTSLKERSTTEIYLSNKEVKSIIKALESSLIQGDE